MAGLRVVVALDSLKGSLGSAAAGAPVRLGVLDADPTALAQVMPVADGGEGTLAAVAAAVSVTLVDVDTVDALGRPLRASYRLLEGDGTAVVKATRTLGLELLP